jgi:multidrug transporter EmrE-like cation transporter
VVLAQIVSRRLMAQTASPREMGGIGLILAGVLALLFAAR